MDGIRDREGSREREDRQHHQQSPEPTEYRNRGSVNSSGSGSSTGEFTAVALPTSPGARLGSQRREGLNEIARRGRPRGSVYSRPPFQPGCSCGLSAFLSGSLVSPMRTPRKLSATERDDLQPRTKTWGLIPSRMDTAMLPPHRSPLTGRARAAPPSATENDDQRTRVQRGATYGRCRAGFLPARRRTIDRSADTGLRWLGVSLGVLMSRRCSSASVRLFGFARLSELRTFTGRGVKDRGQWSR